jgi:hypothetical protein
VITSTEGRLKRHSSTGVDGRNREVYLGCYEVNHAFNEGYKPRVTSRYQILSMKTEWYSV